MATQREIETEAARPMAFFSHDTNASQDLKMVMLLEDYGMVGYGRWWRLCEMLGAADGHRLQIGNERIARIVAHNLMCSDVDELMTFLLELKELGLLVMDGDGYISSRRMDRNAEYFGRRRAAGRKGGKARTKAGEGA